MTEHTVTTFALVGLLLLEMSVGIVLGYLSVAFAGWMSSRQRERARLDRWTRELSSERPSWLAPGAPWPGEQQLARRSREGTSGERKA